MKKDEHLFCEIYNASKLSLQVRKDLKHEKKTLEEAQVTDTDFDEIPLHRAKTERVAVCKRDLKRSEEPKKRKYQKELDVGRIVMEEIPKEHAEVAKQDTVQTQQIRQKKVDLTVCKRQVEERQKTYAKRDVKVGKLDISAVERETTRPHEIVITHRKIADEERKVRSTSIPFHIYL